eukprot:4404087-Alexandrium_andersonii.AAC.1
MSPDPPVASAAGDTSIAVGPAASRAELASGRASSSHKSSMLPDPKSAGKSCATSSTAQMATVFCAVASGISDPLAARSRVRSL